MNVWGRIGRADWLGELQSLLAVGVAAAAAGAAFDLGRMAWHPAVSVPMRGSAVTDAGLAKELLHGESIDPSSVVDVRIADPTVSQQLLSAGTWLPTFLFTVVVMVLLYRLLRDARRDNPFGAATVRRLRRLAAVTLAGLLAWAAEAAAGFALQTTVTAPAGMTLELAPALQWSVIGFGFLAIAEVVNRGTVMRAELDTVV